MQVHNRSYYIQIPPKFSEPETNLTRLGTPKSKSISNRATISARSSANYLANYLAKTSGLVCHSLEPNR